MNMVTGVIASVKGDAFKILPPTPMKDFNLNFGDGKYKWEVGIDPATRFTGLCFLREDEGLVVLLDCVRDKVLPSYMYEDDLFYLLKRLVKGNTLLRATIEKPFDSKWTRANEVLMALRGKIDSWMHEIPEFAETDVNYVNVNVWKSRVINKSKGKGRFNQKGAIAEDLCDLIPSLAAYKNSLNQGDLDSLDALGIVLGYRKYAFSENGDAKISGVKEKSHNTFIGYRWEDNDAITETYVKDVLGVAAEVITPVLLEFNEDYNLSENFMMASTNNDAVITIIPEKYLQSYQWKLGIDITEPGKVLIAFIFRKGHYSVSEFKAIASLFPMSEEMNGAV